MKMMMIAVSPYQQLEVLPTPPHYDDHDDDDDDDGPVMTMMTMMMITVSPYQQQEALPLQDQQPGTGSTPGSSP